MTNNALHHQQLPTEAKLEGGLHQLHTGDDDSVHCSVADGIWLVDAHDKLTRKKPALTRPPWPTLVMFFCAS